uniref:Uncharacterized protein n=1 Tax=Anguilla anguilla TaxID=7936 RepID=A0A0E9W7V7_ANGAN
MGSFVWQDFADGTREKSRHLWITLSSLSRRSYPDGPTKRGKHQCYSVDNVTKKAPKILS